MGKVNYLFSDSQVFERKHASQQKFEMAFIEELPCFVSSFHSSFERMRDIRSRIEPSARDRNINAVLMNGFVKGELLKAYESMIKIDSTGRFCFIKNGEWILYFKKLNSRTHLPENIETKHVMELHKQYSLSMDERSPVIYIGYTVTSSWDYITGCHAVYAKNGAVIWRTDISNMYSTLTDTPKIIIPDIDIAARDSDIIIRRKSS
jgi:nitrogen fixation protein